MHTEDAPFSGARHVVVVGGGIGGMACARELAKEGYAVTILELRKQLGGRIETADLRGFNGPAALTRRPCFKAEVGPMRFELQLQPRFHSLCKEMGIALSEFSGPSASDAPKLYELDQDEQYAGEPLDALELLKLGVFRMFGEGTSFDRGGHVIPENSEWLANLADDKSDGFEDLRKTARLRGRGLPLYKLGFWNALGEVLSEGAVETIKELGPFFHLLPENPNAAEWGIFWLRLFKLPPKAPLNTIAAGVRSLSERLQAEFDTSLRDRVKVLCRHEAMAVQSNEAGGVEVRAINRSKPKPEDVTLNGSHVIFALPKAALGAFAEAFPTEVHEDLDTVVGFRLLKAFLCMRRPSWWGSTPPAAQTGAWTVPTRELHYSEDDAGENAMVLLYTDEPAAHYWTPFIENPRRHDQAQIGGQLELKRELVLKLLLEKQRDAAAAQVSPPIKPGGNSEVALAILQEVVQSIEGLGEVVDIFDRLPRLAADFLLKTSQYGASLWTSVSDYAIRDWKLLPDGAGCHAWLPGAESWEVRRRLRAFPLASGNAQPCLHVCGEAYSDYQGFIEGALRSAADAVATITGATPPHSG